MSTPMVSAGGRALNWNANELPVLGWQYMPESLVALRLAEMLHGSQWMHSWHSDQACGLCKDHCYSSLLSMLLCGHQTSVSEDLVLHASLTRRRPFNFRSTLMPHDWWNLRSFSIMMGLAAGCLHAPANSTWHHLAWGFFKLIIMKLIMKPKCHSSKIRTDETPQPQVPAQLTPSGKHASARFFTQIMRKKWHEWSQL